MMEDAPSVEYNRSFTHSIGSHIMTRRPAMLSAALRPTRFRLDNREGLGGLKVGSGEELERLAVGVARNAYVGTLRRTALGLHKVGEGEE